MPIRHNIDREHQLLVSIYKGHLNDASLSAYYQPIIDSGILAQLNLELVDMHEVKLADVSPEGFDRLAHMVNAYFVSINITEFHTAVVVATGTALLDSTYISESPEALTMCTILEDACQWLGLTLDTTVNRAFDRSASDHEIPWLD